MQERVKDYLKKTAHVTSHTVAVDFSANMYQALEYQYIFIARANSSDPDQPAHLAI